jgi:hypothetical protein
MYIEADSKRPNQKARLMSPLTTTVGDKCLRFYYNMHGTGIGQLNVYAQSNNNLGSPIWRMSAEQGLDWRLAQVTVRRRGNRKYNVILIANIIDSFMWK